MTIDDGIWIEIKLKLDQLQAGFQSIPGMLAPVAQQIASSFNLTQLSIGAIELGAALTTNLSIPLTKIKDESLQAFAGFEQSMNRVQAMSGTSKEALAGLEQQALQLGSTTQFSASKIATAMGDLASAGLSTEEIYKSLPGVLDFAAAGQIKLADAAKVSTQIMHEFGMTAGDMGKIADVIAYSAAKSSAEVSDMGVAFNYFGPIAKQANISMAQTAAAFEILADAGTRGSKAGTAMRAMIADLENPSKKAQAALDALGISVKDAAGNLLPLDQLIGNLQPLMDHTGEGFQIFGKRFTEVVSIIGKGPEEFRKLTADVENASGAASKMASTLMQGYSGELKKFTDELDSMHVKIGKALAPASEAFLKNFGEPIVKMVGDLADGFRTLPLAVQQVGLAFVGIGQWAGPAITALGQLGLAWPLITSGAKLLGSGLSMLIPSLATLGVTAAIAAAAFVGWKFGEWLYQNDALTRKFGDAIGELVLKIPGVVTMINSLSGVSAANKTFADSTEKLASYLKSQGIVIDRAGMSIDDYNKKLIEAARAHGPFNTGAAQVTETVKKLPPVLSESAKLFQAQQQAALAAMQASQKAAAAQAAAIQAAQQAAAVLAQKISMADAEVQGLLVKVPGLIQSVMNALDPSRMTSQWSSLLAPLTSAIQSMDVEAQKLTSQLGGQMDAALKADLLQLWYAEESLTKLRADSQAWLDAVKGVDGEFAALDMAIKASGDHTVDFTNALADFTNALAVIGTVSVSDFQELNAQTDTLAQKNLVAAAYGATNLGTAIGGASGHVNEFGRSSGGIFDSFSKHIAGAILGTEDLSKSFVALGKSVISSLVNDLVKAALKSLLTGVLDVSDAVNGLIKSFGNLGSSVGGVGGKGGGASGGAGSLGGGLNMITGIGSLISGVVGNFQMANIASDTGKIEVNTRSCLNQLVSLQGSANQYWPNLLNLSQLLRLEGIEDALTRMASGSGGNLAEQFAGVVVPPLMNISADVVQMAQAIALALDSFMRDFVGSISGPMNQIVNEVKAFRTQAMPFLQSTTEATIALYNVVAKAAIQGGSQGYLISSSSQSSVRSPSSTSGNTYNVVVQSNSTDAYRQGQLAIQGINSQLQARA